MNLKFRFLLVFCSVLILSFVVSVSAAECTSSPSCGCDVSSTTTFSSGVTNCDGNGIIINADDIILDCNHNIIDGDGNGDDQLEYGIVIEEFNNVSIQNCKVKEFFY